MKKKKKRKIGSRRKKLEKLQRDRKSLEKASANEYENGKSKGIKNDDDEIKNNLF